MKHGKAAIALSAAAGVCAALASSVILAWPGAFPAPPGGEASSSGAEARGWSAVTLAIGLPLLVVGILAARRGWMRGRIAWAGALTYLVYTYLELAVSPPFTQLYLIYIAAFACALVALVLVVTSIEVTTLPPLFAQTPRRAIAIYSIAFSAGLSLAWLKDVVTRTANGELGWLQGDEAIGHVVHALDLGLVVPLGVATGVTLLRRRPAGYLLGGITLVFAVCMGAALPAMVAWGAWAAGKSALGAMPFAMVGLLAAVLAFDFFRTPAPAGFEHPAHSH